MKILASVIIGLLVSLCLDTALAGERMDLHILIDLSDSSPTVLSDQFARKSAKAVDEHLERLELGSTVCINTFGEYSRAKNIISFKFTLLNRKGARSKDVRMMVKKIISRLPELVRNGKLKIQKKTSLIGELKLLKQRLDPGTRNVVIILGDLLEFSADANAYKLIKLKNGCLPNPERNFLEGVEVVALGAGFSVKNSNQNDRLKGIWTKYFKQAGVSKFVYLTDF